MKLQELKANPWRFKPGERCYIAGQPQRTATVTLAFAHQRSGFPHYLVVDCEGNEWTVAQLQLTTTPVAP